MTLVRDVAPGDDGDDLPALDAVMRERRGQLREIYEPVVDEPVVPRPAELMHALEQARTPTW
ncbi:Anti-sigma factor NepR domain-containing protein [Methylorubrum populi]